MGLRHRLEWKQGALMRKELERHLVAALLVAGPSDADATLTLGGRCWRRTFVLPDGLQELQQRVCAGSSREACKAEGRSDIHPVWARPRRVHL